MNSKTLLFSLLATGAAVLATSSALAQDDDAIEEVVVYGDYQNSLKRAIDRKRDTFEVSEAISAEDIGQLPDVTIADTLARLPGLFATKDRGNDSMIVARGLGPRLSLATFNGREIATAEPDRIVRYEQFPSELISGAQVFKTQSANLREGGISATINLETISPLDQPERAVSLKASGLYYDMTGERPNTDDKGLRASGSYIDQYADGTVGLAIGFSYQDQPTILSHYDNWGWNTFSDADVDYDGNPDYAPWGAGPALLGGSAERESYLAKLEFRPSDAVSIGIDAYYTDWLITEEEDNHWACCWDNWDNWQADAGAFNNPVVINNNVVGGEISSGATWITLAAARWHQNNTLVSAGLNGEFQLSDSWSLQGDIAFSEATRDNVWRGMQMFYAGLPGTVQYDYRSERPVIQYIAGESDILDVANYSVGGMIVDNFDDLTDEVTSATLELKRELGGETFSFISFGASFSDREKKLDRRNWSQDPVVGAVDPSLATPYLMDGQLPMIQLDFDAAQQALYGGFDTSNRPLDPFGSWRVTEDTVAAFVMVGIETDWGNVPVYGNFGVRYFETEQTGYGTLFVNGTPEPGQGGLTYDDVLPSFNLNFEIAPDHVLRFAGARAIARAPIDELRAARSINVDTGNPNAPVTGDGGNPALRPFIADQLDLSYEWYFNEESIAAISVFYKDLDSYIGIDIDDTPIDGRPAAIVSSVNSEGGYIQGVELNLQTPFSGLPAPFNDFGINVNVAFNDSNIEEIVPVGNPLPMNGLADSVGAATLWYYRDGFEARLGYSYSGESTQQVNWSPNALQTVKSAEFWDLALSYDVNDSLQIRADFANLSDQPFVTYADNDPTFLGRYRAHGRRYSFGVSYKF